MRAAAAMWLAALTAAAAREHVPRSSHPFLHDGYWYLSYTDAFSGAKAKTPRYNYNQIMYRVRLDDPGLRAAHE